MYSQLLDKFKTIFPMYILANSQIQEFIRQSNFEKSQGSTPDLQNRNQPLENLDLSFNMSAFNNSPQRQQNPNMIQVQSLFEDFIFSETDTLGTVILCEYRQDQKIYYESLKKVFEARDKGPSQRQETN